MGPKIMGTLSFSNSTFGRIISCDVNSSVSSVQHMLQPTDNSQGIYTQYINVSVTYYVHRHLWLAELLLMLNEIFEVY